MTKNWKTTTWRAAMLTTMVAAVCVQGYISLWNDSGYTPVATATVTTDDEVVAKARQIIARRVLADITVTGPVCVVGNVHSYWTVYQQDQCNTYSRSGMPVYPVVAGDVAEAEAKAKSGGY